MSVSLRPISDQVIVITGASSGIGLATAREAAERGAKVVLASRNDEVLMDIQRQINAAGGSALHVTADVSCRDDVENVADAAIDRFGRIDTWVNNAGLSIWGRLQDVSDEDSRRLFETNFWGVVYGSLAALPHLKQRGGALINVGSVVSDVAIPIQGMYSASKHAVKGFTDALRMELEEEHAPVSVTLIKPASIDTPFPQHAKNYTGRAPKLPPPVYQPEEVASAILYAAEHPKRDMFVGGGGVFMSALQKIAPRLMDWYSERVVAPQHFQDAPARRSNGALHAAGEDGEVRGDHPGYVMKSSAYTCMLRHPVLASGCIAAAGFAMATAWMYQERD